MRGVRVGEAVHPGPDTNPLDTPGPSTEDQPREWSPPNAEICELFDGFRSPPSPAGTVTNDALVLCLPLLGTPHLTLASTAIDPPTPAAHLMSQATIKAFTHLTPDEWVRFPVISLRYLPRSAITTASAVQCLLAQLAVNLFMVLFVTSSQPRGGCGRNLTHCLLL